MYYKLLKQYIKNSNLSLTEIAKELNKLGFSKDKSYLSKLQNAKLTPPEEKLTRAIAKVTGGNAEDLIWCAYIINAPERLKTPLRNLSEEVFNSQKKINSNLKFDVVYKEQNDEDRSKIFAEFIRHSRLQKNLSIKCLATKANVSHSYISQIENGKRGIPSTEIIRKLADPLGVPVIELFQIGGYLPIDENDWIEGMNLIRKANSMLNNEEKEKLLRLIEAFLTLSSLHFF
ncbi:helix-turn-helix transcriptional regulator [Gottfriedia acidiceleris]|uniref:Helix-turn-helix domain-containing protein n=1 Tax=Gottfriedia acidiceleris TaxID=371036 RepID=A0ABY4JI29_9BACI|nr:helix-turn-helix domain-containing protein [Gottfriedia acidiceleris]UPM52493.1 helix-turn-helix domain-containing protein [Gottfriedia acidiceleris]